MMPTVLSSIRTALNDDAVLAGHIGTDRVFLGWLTETMEIPCVTITENSERSVPRVCYDVGKRRNCSSVVQIDIWIQRQNDAFPCTIEDIETIASTIDVILMRGITNTYGWRRVSSSGPYNDEDLFHKVMRFEFSYVAQDV